MDRQQIKDGFVFKQNEILGNKLGSGSYKAVYEVKGLEGYVIGVQFSEREPDYSLQNEQKRLVKLIEHNIPCAQWETFGKVDIDSEWCMDPGLHHAAIMKRYAGGNRMRDDAAMMKLMNEKTLLDLAVIQDRLEQADLVVSDLQFLFDFDGSVVVNDPERFCRLDEDDYLRRGNLDLFQRLREVTRFSIAVRQKAVEFDPQYGYLHGDARRWCALNPDPSNYALAV